MIQDWEIENSSNLDIEGKTAQDAMDALETMSKI